MSAPQDSSLSSECVSAEVDKLCDRFETEWKAGGAPQIEHYLGSASAPDRLPLLRELLILEWEYRFRQGPLPTLSEYSSRFPDYDEFVRSCWNSAIKCAPHAESSASKPLEAGFQAPSSFTEGGIDKCASENARKTESPAYHDLLRRTWPFSLAPSEVTHAIAECLQPHEFKEGEQLFLQGDRSGHLLILVDGVLNVEIDDGTQRHVVAEIGDAAVLGEMGLLSGEPSTATVTAMTLARTLALPPDDFRRLARQFPAMRGVLNQLAASRLGQAETDALVGKQFHGYRIERCVARGGMAVVYDAKQLATGRRVALKMMSHRIAHHLEAHRRFEREVDAGATLAHPSICQVYDSFQAFGTCFMVMEYCEGVNLEHMLEQQGPLSNGQALEIVLQLAGALAYAHSHGFVHRDLKPSNVMVGPQRQIKLMDFGLARQIDGDCLTSIRHILGTPRYMSPEQLMGKPVDYRSDVYSLGLLVYEMIAGEPLFAEPDMLAILARQRTWRLPRPSEIRPGLGADIYRIMQTSLKWDPKDRTLDLGRLASRERPLT
jgi:serine/threonine-protein kinase